MPAHKDLNADFPLRGFVCCADCAQPLTANWSKGTHGSYPYYLCRTKGCASAAKSIARSKVEGAFEELPRALVPSQELVGLASHIFNDLWDQRAAAAAQRHKTMSAEISQIDRKLEQLIDRIVATESTTVIKAYEGEIDGLERRKLLLTEKVSECGRPLKSYDETFRTTMDFLASPWKLWESNRLEDKRTVLKLAFAERLTYRRGEGFRTPEISMPFKGLDSFNLPKEENGAPGTIRTSDPQIRSLMLYPAELRVHAVLQRLAPASAFQERCR